MKNFKICILLFSLIILFSSAKESKKNVSVKSDKELQDEFNFISKELGVNIPFTTKSIKGLNERYGSLQKWKIVYLEQLLQIDKGMRKNNSKAINYTCNFYNEPAGDDYDIDINPSFYILEQVEDNGYITLPLCERAGAGGTCAMRLITGLIDDSDQSYLTDEQRLEGFFLPCVSYVLGEIKAKTRVEEDIYDYY